MEIWLRQVWEWKGVDFLLGLSRAFALKWTVVLFANASVKGNCPIRSASAWAASYKFGGI